MSFSDTSSFSSSASVPPSLQANIVKQRVKANFDAKVEQVSTHCKKILYDNLPTIYSFPFDIAVPYQKIDINVEVMDAVADGFEKAGYTTEVMEGPEAWILKLSV